jgi:hypothetical protein
MSVFGGTNPDRQEPPTVHPNTLPHTSPKPCTTCRRGCTCNPGAGEWCEHYGCWGRQATGTCPGVVYEIARYEAQRRADETHRRFLAIRRAANSAAHARTLAREVDARRAQITEAIARHTDRTTH